MSSFWLEGGVNETPYPEEKLIPQMWEDRYFKPGVIHGGCYLIRVYLNDSHGESESDHNQWEVEYIYPEPVMEAIGADPTYGDKFWSTIQNNVESFGVDSMQKDFAAIADEWSNAVEMTGDDLRAWVIDVYAKEFQ